MNHKGNATALEHIAIIKRFAREFGRDKIERVYGDREFGSYELFACLIEEEIDFHIRLKENHPAEGKSFRSVWRNAAEQVRLRGKVKVEVFGLEVYVSQRQIQKGRKNRISDRGK